PVRGPGEPWQPLKLYYIGGSMSASRMQKLASLYAAMGEQSPFAQTQARRRERGLPEARADPVTTLIDISGFPPARAALLAHPTQMDPERARRRISDWESAPRFVQRHGTAGGHLRGMRDGPAHALA